MGVAPMSQAFEKEEWVVAKVLEYKAGLKLKYKFIYVAMCSLVMSPRSRDFHITLLHYITIK